AADDAGAGGAEDEVGDLAGGGRRQGRRSRRAPLADQRLEVGEGSVAKQSGVAIEGEAIAAARLAEERAQAKLEAVAMALAGEERTDGGEPRPRAGEAAAPPEVSPGQERLAPPAANQ